MEVLSPSYPIPDYPTEYEKAYADEARRIEEERQSQWQESERQRGIEDARKRYGQ